MVGAPPPLLVPDEELVAVVHAVAEQTPLQQWSLQQPASTVHAASFAEHDAPHTPALHVVPWQHCAVVVHPVPSALHAWQEPLSQMLEQQSLASTQVWASGKQVPHMLS